MRAGILEASAPHSDRSPAARASVPARLAAHARETPERGAVVAVDATLTYGELDEQAERLSATLRARGAGPGTCVAVLLPRSAQYLVAALAVMKAGAAYLPIDPATPAGRLEYILGDAEVAVVVTDQARAAVVPAGSWTVLDPNEPGTGATADAGAAPVIEPDNLAYVIYTSGSTGRPKGVEITHANLAHLVDWHTVAFGVTGDDRASQVAGLGFDAAVWEVWPHLAAGASVHVADEETLRSPQLLRDWLVERGITVAFAPTLLAEQLMHADWPEGTALRTLLTGADRLNRRPVAGQPFTVVNNYGPTECTVVSTSGIVAPEGDHAGPPSIGKPLPGTVAMVLDESLAPVDGEEPGELVVAGPHVGRGYRNDPERTAARFVTVPAADGTTLRAYRTGDRVRLLADGRLAFLGRVDDQIKIRGYRIEPAEIVTWLTQFPGVGSAAVAALADAAQPADGDRELVAYIVPAQQDDAPSAEDVRAFLAAQLPEYMVPAHVVCLAALPTTPNGKLDTAALPRPVTTPEPSTAAADVPQIQAWLQGMVAELLKLPHVDVDDNIFLLGGHSMLAMQVVARVRQRFGVELSLRQVFRGPTVSSIATEVAQRQGVAS